jgi:hypothetical protein
MKITSYSSRTVTIRSASQSMTATQAFVPGSLVLARVDIAFDWSSSSGYPHLADARAWEVDDAYMFGPDLQFAPVAEYQARRRTVYLPQGSRRTNAWTAEPVGGCTEILAEAPLGQIPLFLRDGVTLPISTSGDEGPA